MDRTSWIWASLFVLGLFLVFYTGIREGWENDLGKVSEWDGQHLAAGQWHEMRLVTLSGVSRWVWARVE